MKGYLLISNHSQFDNFTNLVNSYSSTILLEDSEITNINGEGSIINLIGSTMNVSNTEIANITGDGNTILFQIPTSSTLNF